MYSSATPNDEELNQSGDHVAEQLIRPTGLVDPPIDVRPTANQIEDLIKREEENKLLNSIDQKRQEIKNLNSPE